MCVYVCVFGGGGQGAPRQGVILSACIKQYINNRFISIHHTASHFILYSPNRVRVCVCVWGGEQWEGDNPSPGYERFWQMLPCAILNDKQHTTTYFKLQSLQWAEKVSASSLFNFIILHFALKKKNHLNSFQLVRDNQQ